MKAPLLSDAIIKTILFVFLSIQIGVAQVGIGTVDPQADLHIAGDTSTIRIDGLNATNNVNNDGTSLQPLYVDNNGELTLTNRPSTELLLNLDGVLGSVRHTIDTGSLGESNQRELYATPSFTITRNAMITITYGLGISIENYQAGQGSYVSDGKPKLYRTFFKLGDGSTSSGTSYAKVANTYVNTIDTFPLNQVILTGFMYVNATEHIYLVPGTYSVHLFGRVVGALSNGGASSPVASDAFTAVFGAGSDSYVRVIANYIDQ
jgi:hypothetical protein